MTKKKDTRRDAWNFDYLGLKAYGVPRERKYHDWVYMADDSMNKVLKTVVMCAEKQEVMYTIQEKKESLVFNAVSLTKVRSKEGLQKRIVTLPLQIYVNHDTKTYTIVEYHDEHKVYCIISYGTDLALLQNL